MMIIDGRDRDGILRRVRVPDAKTPVDEGVPVSLDVGSLYEHMPAAFTQALVEALWSRGLVEAADYLAPGAAERVRSALLSVVKADALSLITRAKQELDHG